MKILRIAALALFVLAGPSALAQFEGVVEMKMTAPQASGTMTAWISKVGTRSVMDMQSPELKKSGMGSSVKMVTIQKFADPDTVYFVNDSAKTYSIINTKEMREAVKGLKSGKEETYSVRKLGTDSVAGFSCEKAVVTSSKGNSVEMCISQEITGGSSLLRSLQQRGGNGPVGLLKALREAGLDGYPIRMVMRSEKSEGVMMTMELVSAKRQPVPASTFAIPAGYQKTAMFAPMSNPEIDRKMKEALEKMTPEQRKAYEEMMRGRSGGQ